MQSTNIIEPFSNYNACYAISYKTIILVEGSPRGVAGNVLDCDIVVNEFTFGLIPLVKV